MKVVRSAKSLAALCVLLGAVQGCVSTSAVGSRSSSDQDVAQAHLNLGVGYLRQGRPDLALESLQRALDEDSRLVDAHSSIAIAYDQLGNPVEAERHYRRATQLEPTNAPAANSYAVFLCRQNRWGDAEPFFRRAADNPAYSTPAAALTNAGICALDAGDLDKSESYLRAALGRDARFPEALSGMMELAYRQQNYLQARAFMQRYSDLREPNAQMLWMCFNVERELNNPASANECAVELRRQFPDSAEFAQLQRVERDARR